MFFGVPFSEDERGEVMNSLRRIERKQESMEDRQEQEFRRIEDSQERQDEQIARINRALDDTDENDNNGLKSKVAFVYATVRSWQDRWQGAKYVGGGIIFILTSGIGLLIYNLVSLWLTGNAHEGRP